MVSNAAITPIVGRLRRALTLDLAIANAGLGIATGMWWWYGYHVPAVRNRDSFYAKLEAERSAARD
ncbi:cytochrome c oxidase family protein [Ascobolus immersus RN42]|uniref:Cytochrome c oxidase family protein n=1 Tax=Ascobolus immersus RN42 TaxID=1160509 RepID=A0A3N4HRI5_ASCIM|nr:cytochrome c oxidase family protein [Ascobolus immersus RN42]